MGESPPFSAAKRSKWMAIDLEKIRTTADRVAGSYGLEVVDVEFVGGGKHRVCGFRSRRMRRGGHGWPPRRKRRRSMARRERGRSGSGGCLARRVEHGASLRRHARGLRAFSRDFGTVIDVEDLVPGGSTRWRFPRRGWIAS